MKPLLITKGRIIDPGQALDEVGTLLVTDGKISWWGRGEMLPPATDYEVLPAPGLVVCPGLIDLHCHLREPGFEEKETIATGTRAAAQGGFTTVCCMPNTDPPLDNAATIEYVMSKARAEGTVRVLPIGCISQGRQGKALALLANLASAGVFGFSDDGSPVMDDGLMRQALEFSRVSGRPIIDHCEDTSLSAGGIINEGRVSIKLGLRGIPAAAEERMVARDLALAKETGGWLHITHVSTAGSVELIRRAKKEGVRVTCDVTPHHLTLTEDAVIRHGAQAKVNPPLRTKKDIQALIQGLKDDVIDVIATDHAPHTVADKRLDLAEAPSGISGLETALGSLMSLVHEGEITLPRLISKLAREPAKIIGDKYDKLGTLAIGAPADITIFDPNKEWLVDTSTFASKGRNTPLAGAVLKGKVMATVFGGKLMYKDNSLRVEARTLTQA
ncbi:MAG TPA: dihydroorotase [Dehalococcoidales bacterium]